MVGQHPERDILVRIYGLYVVEPLAPRSLCATRGGGNDATRDEIAERQPKTIAVVGEAVEIVVLVAVFDPDLVARDLPDGVHYGLEEDVVRRDLRQIIRDAGQVIVVVT